MDKLRTFYKNWLRTLTITIATIAFFIVKDFTPWALAHFQNTNTAVVIPYLFSLITSSTFITILFLTGEWIIRNHLWKWINPDLNFSGEWLGTTYYTHLEIPSDKVTQKNFKPFSSNHKIFIEQDCTKIAIVPSPGTEYVNWQSIALSLTDKGTLKFAYSVNYQGNDKFPDNAVGYEEMEVIKRGPKRAKKPILMSGFFHHCAGGQMPVFRGKTIFKRAKNINSITNYDLPTFAQSLSQE